MLHSSAFAESSSLILLVDVDLVFATSFSESFGVRDLCLSLGLFS